MRIRIKRFLAESLFPCCWRTCCVSVLSDASPALPADEFCGRALSKTWPIRLRMESRAGRTSLGITRAGLAKRCVTWLKLLLTAGAQFNGHGTDAGICRCVGAVSGAVRQRTLGTGRAARGLTWLADP